MIHMRKFNKFEEENQRFLVNSELEFSLVQTTETGIQKSILDATDPVRKYFKKYRFHDYESQPRGIEGKLIRHAVILTETKKISTKVSLYKPATKKRDDPQKGDPRFWVYNLKNYTKPDDINLMFCHEDTLYIVNITRIDIAECCQLGSISPIKDVFIKATASIAKVADELLAKFRSVEGQWIPSEVDADTGIGRTIETMLGIKMNSQKEPDFKGIELKSFREKRPSVRKSLFCKVPEWALSEVKSSAELCQKYGKFQDGRFTLHHTLNYIKPNTYNLRLNLNYKTNHLEIEEDCIIDGSTRYTIDNFKKVNDVAVWVLETLHDALLKKHKETFWIEVESRTVSGHEEFKIKQIEHTKNPVVSQFEMLIEQGKITVDLLLGRSHGGDAISFKIKKDASNLLFPQSKTYSFK